MRTKIVKTGKSFGIIIPEFMVKKYNLSNDIELYTTQNGILINPKRKAREGWEERISIAMMNGDLSDDELL
jgi:antitoxin component of MazEF toxin-antitoxin module